MPAVNKVRELDSSIFNNFPGTTSSRKAHRTMTTDTSNLTGNRLNQNTVMYGDSEAMANLALKVNKLEKMVEAVDAKTSSKAICFGSVQLRSKKEIREFIENMKHPSLRFFYTIISLLHLCHADQTYKEGLDLELKAGRTCYDNVEDASIFLSFRDTLPRILVGKRESKATNKNPLPGCKLHAE